MPESFISSRCDHEFTFNEMNSVIEAVTSEKTIALVPLDDVPMLEVVGSMALSRYRRNEGCCLRDTWINVLVAAKLPPSQREG